MNPFKFFWNWLIEMFTGKPAINPESQIETTNQNVYRLLMRKFGTLTALHCGDIKYRLVSFDMMKKFLKWDYTDRRNYIKDFHDCENFTRELRVRANEWCPGICLGEIIIVYETESSDSVKHHCHSMSVDIDDKEIVRIIEPQSDWMFEDFPGDWKNLKVVEVRM